MTTISTMQFRVRTAAVLTAPLRCTALFKPRLLTSPIRVLRVSCSSHALPARAINKATFSSTNLTRCLSSATATNTTNRVKKLRKLMKCAQYNLTAFVIPSEDAHQSEYVAECDERRAYISGFTGSAGLAIITHDSAVLFTDGRYFLQASQQLDSNWKLMKAGLPNVPTWQEYLVKNIPAGSRIGIDPLVFTAADAAMLEVELPKVGSTLVSVPNLVDLIREDRPSRPARKLMTLTTATTGRNHSEKILQLRQQLKKRGVVGCVISGLDEIAWLFNMRGSDVHCNPVFFAFTIISQDNIRLYLQDRSVSNEVRDHLGDHVQICPYDAVYADLKKLSKQLKANNQKMLLGVRTNLAIATALGKENIIIDRSPIMDAKAIKNKTELEGMRQCHLRDAAAVIRYFAWLEKQLEQGVILDEADGAERLQQFRIEQKGYVGPSFDTISSTGPNGAIIHYKPEKPTASIIDPNLVYLCDSGGQYVDGTTDVTRTLHFRTPSAHEKRCFTRVLQGHIAIDTCIFPEGTTGYLLDILSRRALWSDGLDFRHGTGHGVGAFLNVHEGPHGCGARLAFNEVPLAPGMILTNEPGYYEDGEFGIRIENVLIVREVKTRHRFDNKRYYGFEHITFVPIQTRLIERSLLSRDEIQWINQYQSECLKKVSPFLKEGELALEWLKREAVSI
ncbi:Creatinase/aminopeptidase [Lobosporangium transversale]|uniref:Creatinase/aminopeptidase n=1 Tax=Lobosporangium transversale TaxID=64571 RepID=A0A1Y2GJJ2_9FUNG|nr:Creatinase/aminopeptidase [Lobosporangium transversale]ORZ12899.1 Creatinase/aminopeptidase [Lobosporangium transversale]|eukprot:XP_021880248.1 Creatinase/aminopeptidase [Lobosporangium transversale]